MWASMRPWRVESSSTIFKAVANEAAVEVGGGKEGGVLDILCRIASKLQVGTGREGGEKEKKKFLLFSSRKRKSIKK